MKKLLLLFFLSAFAILARAQNLPITGTVKDLEGAPIPSVSVKVKGTTRVSSANASGSFSIEAKIC